MSDVLIVGGGPVGLGLAIDLAQRDITVDLVERYPTIQPIPKGQNLTQRTGEHFKVWGVSQAIRDASPIPHEYGSAGVTTYGTLMSDYAYDWLVRSTVRPYYAADNERLPQYDTERVLRERVAELKQISTYYGWTADAISQDEDGVSISASERDGTDRKMLHARYLVGCDGARSLVRDAAGMSQLVDPHDKRMVLLVFHSPQLNELLERYPGKSYYNVLSPRLDGYWLFFGRVDLEGNWFFHAPVPADTTRDNFDFAAYLHEAVGTEFDMRFDHIGFWDLRIAVAEDYRKGHVFIAGDAAHSHPPYGGFGVNTGLEDSRNLGWKLAATLSGRGSETLLDSYSLERQPVFKSTADDFIARMIREDHDFLKTYSPDKDRAEFESAWAVRTEAGNDEVSRFEPNYEGSPIVFGPEGGRCSALGSHEHEARAGHHLSPQALSSGDGVYQHLSDQFTLLSFSEDDQFRQSMAEASGALGIPLEIVCDPGGPAADVYGGKEILVRPDHFVAWVGSDEPAAAEAVLRRASGL